MQWIVTLCFVLAVWSALFSGAAAWRVAKLSHRLSQPSMRQLAQLSAEITELTDSYSALLKSHEKLRSRIGMRELREKRAAGPSPPEVDSSTLSGAVSRDELRRRAGIMPGLPARHREVAHGE